MFSWFKREEKAAPVSYENMFFNAGNASFMNRDYRAFSEEGFQTCIIVYRVISEISYLTSSIGLKAVNARGEEVPNSRLHRILNAPNQELDYCAFIEYLTSYYLLSGNAYLVTEDESISSPRSMYFLRPDMMTVERNRSGQITEYVFCKGKANQQRFPVNVVTGESAVMHLKTFNPLDVNYGQSPLDAASFSVDVHNEISVFSKAMMQNKGQPPGIVSVKSSNMNEQAISRFLEQLKKNFQGSRNAGKPLIIENGDIDYRQLSEPDKLPYLENREAMAREIAMAFNYPPVLLGFPAGSTFNNVEEARLHLIDATVLPLMKRIVGELNRWLAPMFGDERLVIDYGTVPGIEESRMVKMQKLNDIDYMTIEEKRQAAGLDPDPQGVLLVDSNKLPIDLVLSPDTEQRSSALGKLIYDCGLDATEAKQLIDDAFEVKELSESERTPPESAQNNAKKVLRWREEHGDEVEGMTSVGWRRANQLASGEPLSEDVIKRMAQFNRHRENGRLDDDKKGKPWTDAGYVAWLGWGGTSGIDWAIRKSQQMEE